MRGSGVLFETLSENATDELPRRGRDDAVSVSQIM